MGSLLWVDLNTGSSSRIFKSDVIRKVPDQLYQRCKSMRPYVIRQEGTPEGFSRKIFDIWEDYDIMK
jgi:hypothetical protein